MSEEEKIEEKLSDDNQQPTGNENISEENNKSQTANHKLQTEEMEVHHPHHPTHKKKWTEYLLEFFMLFLAVFLGFLAENWREHIVEGATEKQYIHSFTEDLKSDTAKINQVIEKIAIQQKVFDSLIGVLKAPGFNNHPENVEKYIGSIFIITLFYPTDRTLQQLKNSGGLRLIRKQAASDSIIYYDNLIKEISEQSIDIYNANQHTIVLAQQIISFTSITYRDFGFDSTLLPRQQKLKLITKDVAKIDEFVNWILNFKVSSFFYCDMLRGLKEYAVRQSIFLKKEYHLENE